MKKPKTLLEKTKERLKLKQKTLKEIDKVRSLLKDEIKEIKVTIQLIKELDPSETGAKK